MSAVERRRSPLRVDPGRPSEITLHLCISGSFGKADRAAAESRCYVGPQKSEDFAIGMSTRNTWLTILVALFAPVVGAADPRVAIAGPPVAAMKRVAPAEYRKASDLAERGGAPLDIALAIAGTFEGSTQHILQVNDGGEAPSASRITIVRDGLLDDSVRGARWDIALARTGAGRWRIMEVKRAWRCRRGEPRDRFAAVTCP